MRYLIALVVMVAFTAASEAREPRFPRIHARLHGQHCQQQPVRQAVVWTGQKIEQVGQVVQGCAK